MLLANYAQVNRNTASDWGVAFSNPHAVFKATCIHKFYTTDANIIGETDKSAWYNGYNTSYAVFPAPKAGGLGAPSTARITMSGSAAGAMGINISGSSTITFTVPNADLQLIVSASGAITFTLSTSATLAGALAAAGDATFSITTSTPILGAIVSALGDATVSLSTDGTITATGALAGDILPYTELSPESLATAVWAEILSTGYSANQIMDLLSGFAAGQTSIVDLGGGAATVTFRDINNTKNTIVADMEGSERTGVTLDL